MVDKATRGKKLKKLTGSCILLFGLLVMNWGACIPRTSQPNYANLLIFGSMDITTKLPEPKQVPASLSNPVKGIQIDSDVKDILANGNLQSNYSISVEFTNFSLAAAGNDLLARDFTGITGRCFSFGPYVTLTLSGATLQLAWAKILALPGLVAISEDLPTKEGWVDGARQVNLDPTVWDVQGYKGDPTSTIAVIDQGFDSSLACFAGRVIYWQDFSADNSSVAVDPEGHGTMVGAIAAGGSCNFTDAEGRAVVSSFNNYANSYDSIVNPWNVTVGDNYKWPDFSVNVSAPGDLEVIGSWVGDGGGELTVDNLTIRNSSGAVVASILNPLSQTNYTMIYPVDAAHVGVYSLVSTFLVNNNNGGYYNVSYEVHAPQLIDPPGNNFQGVAPNCQIVALRAVTQNDLRGALYWVEQNHVAYNITTVVCSLYLPYQGPDTNVLIQCNQLVDEGVMLAAIAGNDGPAAGFPFEAGGPIYLGAADKTISVGAISSTNNLTSYSSSGGATWPLYTADFKTQTNGFTTKPDVVAPGGEFPSYNGTNHPLLLPEANTADLWRQDKPYNVLIGSQGTSFAAPVVAGVAQLLVQALGGMTSWQYSSSQALQVKSLILMTATETNQARDDNPLTKLDESQYSPTLDRGGKDTQEGYGRINPAAAIQAVTTQFNFTAPAPSGYLWGQDSGPINATRCWATRVFINSSSVYQFTLANPPTGDFDLYLYQVQPTSTGDPVIFMKSVNAGLGINETLPNFSVFESGMYYLVVKAVSGEGLWNLQGLETLDIIPPSSCSIFPPGRMPYLAGRVIVNVTGTDDQTGIHRVELWARSSGTTTFLASAPAGQNITWVTTQVPDGNYTIYGRAYDGNNNALDSSNTFAVVVDNTPPDIAAFRDLVPYSDYGGTIYIWVDAADALSGVASCVIGEYLHNISWALDVSGPPPYLYIWQTDSSMDGLYWFYLNVTDRAGNTLQTAYLPIYIANVEMLEEGMMFLGEAIVPALLFGYYAARYILLKEGLTRALAFAEQLRTSVRNRDWVRLKSIFKMRQLRRKRNLQSNRAMQGDYRG
ncbi:MAG TPA: S8 family serine peptidase [Candidatus Lokiarchaeia archaeon]|nr:S8 family serine peptidase [Candidatus Lokiarchaeia archaeon]